MCVCVGHIVKGTEREKDSCLCGLLQTILVKVMAVCVCVRLSTVIIN